VVEQPGIHEEERVTRVEDSQRTVQQQNIDELNLQSGPKVMQMSDGFIIHESMIIHLLNVTLFEW
jgi:hypothetical protein